MKLSMCVVAALLTACSPEGGSSGRDSGAGRDASGGNDAGRDAAGGRDGGGRDAMACVPAGSTEALCDGVDDDCNGVVDDVDTGGDGICDCLAIGILGNPGANPSASFQTWLTSRGTSAVRFATDAATTITPDLLDDYDVIILDWLPREYTATEADALRAFVDSGGGVMVMTGHDGGSDRVRAGALLSAIGLEYTPGLLNGPVTEFVAHPLNTGLTSVTFEGGYRVATTAGLMGSPTTTATLAGAPAGIAVELGAGRIYAWGDEWVEFDSEWSTMPMIAQFWVNTLGWLAPRDSCRTLF